MTDTPAERGAESTWTRLRRRKVVQWGLVYVAAAWGFLQGLEYVSEAFHWPEQLRQIALLALLIGLPIVLVLAWYHGDRGEQRFRGTEIAIIALLFLAGGGIFWRYDRTSDAPTSADNAAALAATAASPQPAALPDEKSIAVLPFADMSAAKDQEYMADGMAEELLNLLSNAPDLKVIARTSSFAFKGKDVNISEIAKQLNVAHVLEGSVRTSGNKIRITAQLIRTADSTHLWSETYDRTLDDIFAIQDEIADAIAQALQIRLAGGVLGRREGGTQNLEAYQLYLRSRSANLENTRSSLDAAGAYLEQAIKVDPSYGQALAALAENFANKADNGFVDSTKGYESSRQLANQALQVSPESAYAHSRLQYVYLNFDWDWAAAEAVGRRARAISATDPDLLNQAGMLSYAFGQWDDAEKQFQESLVRDPLNTYVLWNLGYTYYAAGRFAESEAVYRKLLEIAPDFGWGRNSLGKTLLADGNAKEAVAVVEQIIDEGERLRILPVFLQAVGRQAEADEALRAQIARWTDTGAFYISMTYAYRGDDDLAFEWLERAYKQRDPFLIYDHGRASVKGGGQRPTLQGIPAEDEATGVA